MRITNSTKNTHNKRKKRKRYYDEPLCSLAFLKGFIKQLAFKFAVILVVVLFFSVLHYYKTENKTTFNMTSPVDSKTQTTSANEDIA